jgi:cytochrome c-type biogenesis protein
MPLIILSFIAGVLTVLAPCVFPLLPIIIGGSTGGKNYLRPILVTAGLVFSIIIFTVILKLLLPPSIERSLVDFTLGSLEIRITTLSFISGILLIFIGVITIWPELWDAVSIKLGFSAKSDQLLDKASHKESWYGPLLVGGSLGPVFTSCSPTFGVLVAIILPQDFGRGLINIISYSLGLGIVMLAAGVLGQSLVRRMKWLSNPQGIFKKVIGVIFVIVGIFVLTSLDKQLETFILEQGYFEQVIEFEQETLEEIEM